MIPNKLILDPAFNSLTSSSIRVYILLLTRWTRDKEKVRKPVILTYSDIESITGLSSQTVSKTLKELANNGYIEVEHGGKNNPNKITITYSHLTKHMA